jgi:hypothetical protein
MLQILFEKKPMELMTYQQDLCFNIISLQIQTLYPPFHKSVKTCGVKFFAGVAISTGRPTRYSSCILVRPYENFWTQLCSPYMGIISLCISFAATPFCPQKPHNATLFCYSTRIQRRRHLATAALSLQSCAYRPLRFTIKIDSAAI